jgi:outer membrane receptor protein involved in Fe transport
VTALADNIGFFRVKGFDIEASYSFDVADYGTVNVATQLGIVDSYEYPPYDGAEIIECQGVYGGSCGTPLPELRNRFTTTWMTPWDVTLNLTWRFLDKVDQISTDLPNIPVEIDSQSYFDLAGTWTVTDYASVRLGVNNLLDEDAPIVPQGATARENGNTYPGIYDHLGQYWFVGATVQF